MRGAGLSRVEPHATQGLVPPSREIRSLTGIRGLAALYVVFHHYFQSARGLQSFAYTFRGYLSVDLFFILSGFVLTLTYRDRLRSAPVSWRAYAEFVYTRLARIYPAYLVILVAVLGAIALGVLGPVSVHDAVANLLLVQAWALPAPSINGPGWSISTEFAAYLVFPFLATLVLKPSRTLPAVVAALAVAALCFVAAQTDAQLAFASRRGPLDVYSAGTTVLARCFGGFALGVVACRLTESAQVRRLFGVRGMADLLVLIVIVAWRFPALDVVTVLLFVPLVMALAQERSIASRVLGWGAVYQLGVISYSLYLLHSPLAAVFREPLEHWLAGLAIPKANSLSGLLLLLPLLVLSTACFYGVERPARDSARRLLRRWKRRLSFAGRRAAARPRALSASSATPACAPPRRRCGRS